MKYICLDCKGTPDLFMVSNEVWQSARLDPEKNDCTELICFGCLEKRLKRQLNIRDFPPTNNANRSVYFGYGLSFK